MKKETHKASMALAMSLFLLCGFSTVLNDLLIPFLQNALNLSYTKISLIQVFFYLGYFVFSPLTSLMMRNRTYLDGIRLGIFISSFSLLLVYFGVMSLFYSCVLTGIFFLGGGIAMIQVTANPFTLLLGSEKSASSRLTLTQTFTSVGTLLAPFIGSICILSYSTFRISVLYGSLVVAWLVVMVMSNFGSLIPKETHRIKSRFVWNTFDVFGFFAICMSVGVEVSVGSYLIKFLTDPNVANLSFEQAGRFMMLYWFGFVTGRLLGSYLLQKYHPFRILFSHVLVGFACSFLVIVFKGLLAAIFVLSLGFCSSILFPVIFSLVLGGTKNDSRHVSGFLCMGNIGGALLPLTQGFLADQVSLHFSFIVPLTGYGIILLYVKCLKASYILSTVSTPSK